ncbi:MAG: MBL fold metallo-hydrolase [Chloroflexi bacterium]|jgi:glyoxylase-like metal-dependent hydrolase (beta-lactamase superfamily II)|nr:MBL fold metallo-hydrolase [Anaerolineaceae bacterium]NMD27535.1 MBL fold metallo-hydrolase [Chloroflexota bacterium]
MQRERVSENVYWFQSEFYAQVTAGAVIGPQWAVLIDTLIPQETTQIKEFLENDLMVPVRYIVDTHHHADHSWGNSYFPEAIVIGHSLCRELMLTKSRSALEEAGQDNPFLREIAIVPPQITFSEGSISLRVGKKQLQIFRTPGHTADSISVLVEEDRILFAGDAFMAVPFIVGGNLDEAVRTISDIGKMSLENIVQGHGDIILRGEIEDATTSNLAYLRSIQKLAKAAARRRDPLQFLQAQDIESSGKSRVSLGGVAEELHQNNLRALLKDILRERSAG